MEYTEVDPNSEEEVDVLLHRYFMPEFRKGYARFGPNKVLLPINHLKFVDRLENMKVRDSDIWVVSHPKTGTTWTQEMIWCIANNMDLEGAKKVLSARFPFLDHASLFDYSNIISKKPELEEVLPPVAYDSIKFVDELPSPRFIKTHLPWELLPKQIQEGVCKPKIVYVARNAKDTCVSYFHHCQLMEGFTGSFEDFCNLFLGNTVCFAPFWSHILSFWKRREQSNILFLKYEDLKKDLPGIIRQTAAFLGKDISNEQVECLTKHLSFESMRTNPAVNYEDVVEINHKFGLIPTIGHFMRSGRTGEYKEKMSPEIITRFDHWTEENLKGSGLTL